MIMWGCRREQKLIELITELRTTGVKSSKLSQGTKQTTGPNLDHCWCMFARSIGRRALTGSTPTRGPTASTARLRRLHIPHSTITNTSPELAAALESYVDLEPRPIALSSLFSFQKPSSQSDTLSSSAYVRSEIPCRLARVIRNFDKLPYICGTNPFIARVHSLYKSSFHELCNVPPITNQRENEEHAARLEAHVQLHANDIPTLSKGFVHVHH